MNQMEISIVHLRKVSVENNQSERSKILLNAYDDVCEVLSKYAVGNSVRVY